MIDLAITRGGVYYGRYHRFEQQTEALSNSKEKASYVAGPSWDVYPFSCEEF